VFARPKLLSLITTHRCTAACDHCCFGCSPKATKAIPVRRMHGLIDEAAAIGSIEMVGFTGGECFLLGRKLDALVARATGHGLRTRAVTNGYWAVSAAAARARVAALRAAGLGELHLSTGMFHQRYVPVERVLHGARAAAEAGLVTSVVVEECEGSTFDAPAVHAALADLVARDRLVILRQPWIAHADGRGEARLAHDPSLSRFRPENRGGCASILNVLSVTPDQTLIACCGYTMEAIPELHLGSVAERSIAEVLHAAPNDLLKYWIHVDGPEAVLDFVKRFEPDYPLPVESPDMCQTCLHLHRDKLARQVLRDHLDALPVRRILAAFNTLMLVHQRLQPARDAAIARG
jgi:pyruvate-formate lyase-activating enzyme